MNRNILKIAALLIIFQVLTIKLYAKEGMWIPLLLSGALENDMQSMGMKLTAEDIYSINRSSLKDAIVNFGGCTASMISPDGLLLTNHHCGYSHIQSHSSVENDLLTNGFWARNSQDELVNPDLRVYFIKQIEDVTKIILKDIDEKTPETDRQAMIGIRMDSLRRATVGNSHFDVFIRPFYYGNEYYMFTIEVFRDVRLVGAPPNSIGKFGGDTDNWMWPRHTGDFALYRVYTGRDGKPASYHKDNVPYRPEHHLPININGVRPGDFTMIFGFPGRTTEYLASPAVDQLVNRINPHRIKIRDAKLNVLHNAMSNNDTIRIKYAVKYARVSNAYKKWIGENMGLKNFDAIQKKQDLEKRFTAWLKQDNVRRKQYGHLLDEFNEIYKRQETPELISTYMDEAVYGVEAFSLASRISQLAHSKVLKDIDRSGIVDYINRFYRDYDRDTDQRLFVELIGLYINNIPEEYVPGAFKDIRKKYGGSMEAYAAHLYSSSVLFNREELIAMVSSAKSTDLKKLRSDPFIRLQSEFAKIEDERINPVMFATNSRLEILYRSYVRGLKEMFDGHMFYPDANGTMRISYGRAEGSKPRDGMRYLTFTTLDGVMQKEDPDNPEFVVPEKLKQLHKDRDYGIYGTNDTIYVCFLASNHTTGGNSGSPIIDANGNLIGLNFDRTWESTMSDVMYDPDICRNISVDVRYILFIVDKFADAGYLIDEMTLVGIEEWVEDK
jgi:hypothetical protein